jgi:thiosulfate/3-mercaptopyruvate sulfurtransferase
VSGTPADFRPEPRSGLRAAWSDLVDASHVEIVDARSEDEFTGAVTLGDDPPGHIPGASSVPWLELTDGQPGLFVSDDRARAALQRAGVSSERSAIVYCRSGPRAAVVTLVMRQAGYAASLYDGSWMDWTRRKLPREQIRP